MKCIKEHTLKLIFKAMWYTEINKTHTEGLETDPCIKEKEEIND